MKILTRLDSNDSHSMFDVNKQISRLNLKREYEIEKERMREGKKDKRVVCTSLLIFDNRYNKYENNQTITLNHLQTFCCNFF